MDLDPLREFAEDEMTDTCRIRRDTARSEDDTYDEDTAEYSTGTGIVTVYNGKCFVSTQGWQPRDEVQGGAEVTVSAFKLVLPVSSPKVMLQDMVEITSSFRNPKLKGQDFIVDDRIDSSHSISQNLLMHRTQHKVPG